MSYSAHMSGDCGPGCGPCANECAGCLQWLHECVCPTLPLDAPILCDWHAGVVRDLDADAAVAAALARACDDCEAAE